MPCIFHLGVAMVVKCEITCFSTVMYSVLFCARYAIDPLCLVLDWRYVWSFIIETTQMISFTISFAFLEIDPFADKSRSHWRPEVGVLSRSSDIAMHESEVFQMRSSFFVMKWI